MTFLHDVWNLDHEALWSLLLFVLMFSVPIAMIIVNYIENRREREGERARERQRLADRDHRARVAAYLARMQVTESAATMEYRPPTTRRRKKKKTVTRRDDPQGRKIVL